MSQKTKNDLNFILISITFTFFIISLCLFANVPHAFAHIHSHEVQSAGADQVVLANSYVMNTVHKSNHNLSPLKLNTSFGMTEDAITVSPDLLQAYSLEILPSINIFQEFSHELGICGGFSQINKKDLNRIQKNLITQRQKHHEESKKVKQNKSTINADIKVKKNLEMIERDSIQKHINHITQFENRIARRSNNTEIESIKSYIEKEIKETSLPHLVELVSHKRTPQKSIHVQVPGENPDKHLIFGGHIDSINMMWSSHAPGADDNASGSAALIEILKVYLQQNKKPKHTLDFYWYAGEESGLIGSGEIASEYAKNNVDVSAVLQLDMAGVPNDDEDIFLESDFSSPLLNQKVKDLAQAYLPEINVANMSCGYPCSDHSSWYQENYPVVFPTSGDAGSRDYNRRIHTSRDTKDTLSIDYLKKVAQLGLAFLLEADKK